MKEHRKTASDSKAAKLTAMALKNVIPEVHSRRPSSAMLTNDAPAGLMPVADKPAFKDGGKVHGFSALKRMDRAGRATKARAMGGAVDADYSGEKMSGRDAAKAAVASAALGANPRIGYRDGGAVKGKKGTVVNVIVAPQAAMPGGPSMPPALPVGGPPMPPVGIPAPKPATAGPPPGAGPFIPGNMPPPNPMPMPGRKAGGRVSTDYDAGAGSGEGRMEKVEKYGSRSKEKPET